MRDRPSLYFDYGAVWGVWTLAPSVLDVVVSG